MAALIGAAALRWCRRQALLTTSRPKGDATDPYLFISYEPGGLPTSRGNDQPLENLQVGPNYCEGPQTLYEMYSENTDSGNKPSAVPL